MCPPFSDRERHTWIEENAYFRAVEEQFPDGQNRRHWREAEQRFDELFPYTGWTIIHRTSGEYNRHFPQYADQIQDALEQEFPGADVLHQPFHRSADEPIVFAPTVAEESQAAEAATRAREVCQEVARRVVAGDGSAPSGSSQEAPAPASNGPNPRSSNASDLVGTWMVIIPMFQLEVSDETPINGCWTVGDISFVSQNYLATLLPRTPPPAVWERIANEDTSFAVLTRQGTPNKLRASVFHEARQAANVLAATAAFYLRRHHVCGFTLKGYPYFTARNDRFFQIDGSAFCGNWNQRGFLHPFCLDAKWHKAITRSGIIDLFDRLTDTTLDRDWRRQITSGAGMLGRSLMSLDLADAFLLNVIGLETLLTRQRERNGRRLAQRIKGMTGWHLRCHRPNYDAEIRNIHNVRCEIVHDSDYSNLTTELLLLSDQYLANSLLNIVRLPHVFPDKTTLADLADGFAENENWPTDGTITFRWCGNATFDAADLKLPLW